MESRHTDYRTSHIKNPYTARYRDMVADSNLVERSDKSPAQEGDLGGG